MSDQLWLFIVTQVVTAAGIYAAIRADLREALTRIGFLERWRDRVEAGKK